MVSSTPSLILDSVERWLIDTCGFARNVKSRLVSLDHFMYFYISGKAHQSTLSQIPIAKYHQGIGRAELPHI